MKRTTIVLPQDLLAWLSKEAKREDRSLAGEIRVKLEFVRQTITSKKRNA